ncbi:hypothetical protein DLM45_04720 [Hyphomicrobium methylovorum]|nr:hypothetical protein [Hyphomicrobium methylovorum]
MKRVCAAAFVAVGLSSAAWAEAPMRSATGRFTMSPVEGGFLRLDTETGAVSMCAGSSPADWTCRPVDDATSPVPLPDGTARLEQENKELKDRLRSLEGPPEPPGGRAQIPTEEEVDQALDYLERVYKKFRDRIKNLDKPEPPPANPPPPADPVPPKGSL